jgi:hypothetical protein
MSTAFTPPDPDTQAALIEAAMEHLGASGAGAFLVPVPGTNPQLFVALGTPQQLLQALGLLAEMH